MIRAAATLLLAGCTTTNINAPQPNLQTATQSIGGGDVQGATVSNTKTQTRQPATIPPAKKEE